MSSALTPPAVSAPPSLTTPTTASAARADLAPLRRLVPFVAGLRAFGDSVALVCADESVTYSALAARVAHVARSLGAGRRLVMIGCANQVDVVVHYLAALHAGHPVLLVPGGSPWVASLERTYDPDVVVRHVDGRCVVDERREGSAHDLHPDLALLLSTSGSTGSPKLVRLSHDNLQSNAAAIADSLGIGPEDRAATTVPLHYCYGLSVLHSHLLRGAGVILTDLSVVDPCFWDLFSAQRGTSIAGVPFTFELLDRVGFASMELPHLRSITQAGGRLAPDQVRRYAELGARRGWDLVVMYGQTEATARMAYLPPHLAAEHPGTIGRAVPGGSLRLEPVPECDDDDVGELVYRGPNVMLGYAQGPLDLAAGRTVTELRTGDLARRTADGLYQVVARRSRFVKVLGLRIDLDRVERLLVEMDLEAACVGDDERLLVAVAGLDVHPAPVHRWLVGALGVPGASVVVEAVGELPRLATGKVDLAAVRELVAPPPTQVSPPIGRSAGSWAAARARVQRADAAGPGPSTGEVTAADLRDLFASLLDRPDATVESTFVDLGGDSLSYVEVSLRLEEALGHLPAGWHTTPVRDLVPRATTDRHGRRPVRFGTHLEMSVALRAVAIVMVVLTHANVLAVVGGAHLLLGVAGFNFGRFQLGSSDRLQRLRSVARSMLRLAVPSVVWIAATTAFTPAYDLATVLLLNNVLGPDRWGAQWHFWFLEAVLYIVVAVAALLTVPVVERLERRSPFGFALVLLGAGLLFRFGVLVAETGPRIQTPQTIFWLFALGWAAAKAVTVPQRLVVGATAALTVPGFFDNASREAIVVGGLVLLVWVTSVPCPRVLARTAGVLAGSSLYVYVTHWMVYPHLENSYPLLAAGASFAVGIAYWRLTTWATAAAAAALHRRRAARPA